MAAVTALRPRLLANFWTSTTRYKSIINYGVKEIPRTKEMSSHVKNYVDLFHKNGIMTKKPYMSKLSNDMFDWLLSVHKLQPVQFHMQSRLDFLTFLEENNKHMEFCHKIQPKLPNFKINDAIEEYYHFLMMCKDNPKQLVIPTLREDFIWHSHMQDHEIYVKDTIQIFGHILDHRTDLEMERVKPISDEIRQKSLKTKEPEKDKNKQPTNSCGACTYYYPGHYSQSYYYGSHSPYYANSYIPLPIPIPIKEKTVEEVPVNNPDNHYVDIDHTTTDIGSTSDAGGGSSCGGGSCGGGGCGGD